MKDRNLEIGQRIRILRKSLGLSQNDLGKKIQSSGQNVQKYETGKSPFPIAKIEEFAEIFKNELSANEGILQNKKLTEYLIWGEGSGENLQSFCDESIGEPRLIDEIEDPTVRKNVIKLIKAVTEASKAECIQDAQESKRNDKQS